MGEIRKGDTVVADIEELGKFALEIHARRLNDVTQKKTNFSYSQLQTTRQNCLEEIMKFENQLWDSMNL